MQLYAQYKGKTYRIGPAPGDAGQAYIAQQMLTFPYAKLFLSSEPVEVVGNVFVFLAAYHAKFYKITAKRR